VEKGKAKHDEYETKNNTFEIKIGQAEGVIAMHLASFVLAHMKAGKNQRAPWKSRRICKPCLGQHRSIVFRLLR
jgi:hypothetical protein